MTIETLDETRRTIGLQLRRARWRGFEGCELALAIGGPPMASN